MAQQAPSPHSGAGSTNAQAPTYRPLHSKLGAKHHARNAQHAVFDMLDHAHPKLTVMVDRQVDETSLFRIAATSFYVGLREEGTTKEAGYWQAHARGPTTRRALCFYLRWISV